MKGGAGIADAAYLASRAESYEKCAEMDRGHEWDGGVSGDVEMGGGDG